MSALPRLRDVSQYDRQARATGRPCGGALIAGVVAGGSSGAQRPAYHDLTPIGKPFPDVRFGAHNGLKSDIAPCLKSAKNGSHQPHSITSSASATKFGGSSMPVAFATFRLITNG
jgi:hypothetical protein